MDKDDDLSLIPILLLLLFILLVHTIIMNGITPDAVFYGAVILWMGILTLFIKYLFKPKYDNWYNNQESHKKKLVDKILKRFIDIQIAYAEGFNVSLQVVDELRNKKIFFRTLQHLKAYETIWKKWNEVEEINKQLKIKWEKLEEYILNKIERELGDNYKDCLSFPLWVVVKDTVLEDKKSINIEMKEHSNGKYIDISLLGKPWAQIHLKGHSMNKIKKFLTDLQKDNKSNHKITELQETHKKLNGTISQFKSEIDGLLEDIDNKVELKGKCDGCLSFWK